MRVSDRALDEVRTQGFTLVEDFLDAGTLKAAQDAMWRLYPKPDDYFADPSTYPLLSTKRAGIRSWPYPDWALSRLPVLLIDAAERLLATADLEIYKVELWAKYSGAYNYEQPHHRDYGNHTLVVPSLDGRHRQMTTFILLSDVTAQDAPTKLIPVEKSRDLPLVPAELPMGALFEHEIAATGPAGSLLIYRTDVFHRASTFTVPGRARFAMLVDLQERGWRWQGKMAWAHHAQRPGMTEAMVRMTPRQRDLFGWPPPGSDYWTEQTLRDVAARYPGIDLTPYAPDPATNIRGSSDLLDL